MWHFVAFLQSDCRALTLHFVSFTADIYFFLFLYSDTDELLYSHKFLDLGESLLSGD